MKTISFANLKGGSGKTTSALSIGAELARRGQEVLLLDMDPQGSLSVSVLNGRYMMGMRDLLRGDADPAACVEATEHDHLDIVPADRDLSALSSMKAVKVAERLRELLRAAESAYDWCFVDTPPSEGSFVTGPLLASDEVLVPVQPGRGALDGLGDTLQLAAEVGGATVSGAFVCGVKGNTVHDHGIVDYVAEQVSDLAYEAYVRDTIQVREAEMDRTPLPFYAKNSGASRDYRKITNELLERHEQEA